MCGVKAYNAKGASTKATIVITVTQKDVFDERDIAKITESQGSGDNLKALSIAIIIDVSRLKISP